MNRSVIFRHLLGSKAAAEEATRQISSRGDSGGDRGYDERGNGKGGYFGGKKGGGYYSGYSSAPLPKGGGKGLGVRTKFDGLPSYGKGVQRARPQPVDRTQQCPSLIRIFYRIGGHHGLHAFEEKGPELIDSELQLYSWPDATLMDLVDLTKDVLPEARIDGVEFSFRLIYPDKHGQNMSVALGRVNSWRSTGTERVTLGSTKFQVGDLIDLALYMPQ